MLPIELAICSCFAGIPAIDIRTGNVNQAPEELIIAWFTVELRQYYTTSTRNSVISSGGLRHIFAEFIKSDSSETLEFSNPNPEWCRRLSNGIAAIYFSREAVDAFNKRGGFEAIVNEVVANNWLTEFLAEYIMRGKLLMAYEQSGSEVAVRNGSVTTEPGHDQQVEEKEPTDAASYVVWRRKRVRSIHDGQIMLEVQERWGRPPTKTMNRTEIAALVRGDDPPNPKDTNQRQSLEDAFKNTVKAYRATLKK